MINVRLMSNREVREMQSLMNNSFGSIIEGLFLLGSKGRVYLVTKPVSNINPREVNAEGMGLYIGRINPEGFRPSIEGIQLLRPTKNLFELNEEQLKDWLMGYKIELKTKNQGYCTLTYKGDLLGPGKIANGHVWNYISKERRIKKITEEI